MDIDATVGDVITREYVGVSESDAVRATVELMRSEQASSVLVLRGDRPVGILTEYDVLELVADGDDPAETPVSSVMSSPVESVPADHGLTEAAGMMSTEGIRNLVVEDAETGAILGVLTDRDIIAAVASLQRTVGRETGGPAEPGREAVEDGEPMTAREEPMASGQGARTARDEQMTATGGVGTTNEATAESPTFVTQGVCEECGSLSETLYDTNGQLVCPDCREV